MKCSLKVAFPAVLATLSFSMMLIASESFYGTWKLNVAKSSIKCSDVASTTMKITETGPNTYVNVTDSISKSGQAHHSETGTRYLDGKDHPIPGRPGYTQSMQRVDASTHIITFKKDGKIVSKTTATISADGNVQTNRRTFDSCEEILVFERQ